MGIDMRICALSESNQSVLRREPERVDWLLWRDDEAGASAFDENGLLDVLDLDQSWHGIHYLLTQTASDGAPPLNALVSGGSEFGDDMGYGPPRFLSSSETAAFADALASLSDEILVSRYNADEKLANEILPVVWEDEEQLRGCLTSATSARTSGSRCAEATDS